MAESQGTSVDRTARRLRPLLRAARFGPGNGGVVQLLTEKQQADLGSIATEVNIGARGVIYHAGTAADAIFIIDKGVVKAFRDTSSGKRRVLAFHFPGDAFGLAENGRYVNTTQVVTPATVFRIPVEALAEAFRRDSELELQFLCKVTHELRKSQRQQIVMGRRDAPGRVAMFLHMLERNGNGDPSRIELPMSRADIGHYLGLSPEVISRATARLRHEGIVSFPSTHVAQIVNRARFDRLATAV